jgi:hypothetical protein
MKTVRRYPRLKTCLLARLFSVGDDKNYLGIEVCELSAGGCLAVGDFPIGEGRVMFLMIRFPHKEAVFVATARYEYYFHGKFFTGFAFDEEEPIPVLLQDVRDKSRAKSGW